LPAITLPGSRFAPRRPAPDATTARRDGFEL
jgi:hypothetical protein